MRVVKFSLLTVVLLFVGMMYFGRDTGAETRTLGRETSLWSSLFGDDGAAVALLNGEGTKPAPTPQLVVAEPEVVETPAAPSSPEVEVVVAEVAPGVDEIVAPGEAPVLTLAAGEAPVRSLRPVWRPNPSAETPVEAALAAEPGQADAELTEVLAEVAESVPAAQDAALAGLDDSAATAPATEDAPVIVSSALAPEATARPPSKPTPPPLVELLPENPVEGLPEIVLDPLPETAEAAPVPELAPDTPADNTLADSGLPGLESVSDLAAVVDDLFEAPPALEPEITATAGSSIIVETPLAALETAPAVTEAAVTPLETAVSEVTVLNPLPEADGVGLEPLAVETAVPALTEPEPEVLAAVPLAEPEPLAALPEPEPAPTPALIAPTLPDDPQGVLYVVNSDVIVRAGPTEGDRAIDRMPQGSAVVDLGGEGDGWRMIMLPNGAAGYMPDTELTLTPSY